LATLFWGGNSVAGKLAVGHVSPMVIVIFRWVSVMVALYFFNREQIKEDWPVMRSRMPYLLFLGALGFTGFSVSLYYALIYTSAINASILQGGTPLVVFAASYVLYSSRITVEQAVGFLISFVGVLVIAAHGELDNLIGLNINFGDALILVAIIGYGIYTAALRSKPPMHWTSLMFVLCLGASISSFPMLVLEIAQGAAIFPDLQGWLVLAYIVIFPTLLGQVFYIRAVELIGGNRAGLFINLLPLWGAVLAVVLLGEAFHLFHAVALALILAGIGLAEYGGRKLSQQK